VQKPRQSIIARHPAECWRHEGTGTGKKKKYKVRKKKSKIEGKKKRKDIPDDDRIIPVYCPLDRERELWTQEDRRTLSRLFGSS
jgi:hypothetical protein